MMQIKPLSHGIDNFKKLVIELNRNFDTVVKMINQSSTNSRDESLYEKPEEQYHLFGGSTRDSFAAKYFGLGYVASSDSVPNNSIYTTDGNFYYIKDLDGVSREIGSTGEGGAYLPIDGTAVNSELLDGFDSSYFAPVTDLNTHTVDTTIHFEVGDIDHTAIANVGANTHADIDSHIADTSIHWTAGDIDHGSLSGLGDDDHPQYLNQARGDARYYTETESDALFEPVFAKNTAFNKNFGTSAGTVAEGNHTHPFSDHGALAGLADDDHTQYFNQSRGDARYGLINWENTWSARQTFYDSYWRVDATRYMNMDPRHLDLDDHGRLHIWTTKYNGDQYGQAGLALFNNTEYVYLDTDSTYPDLTIKNSFGNITLGPKNATYCHIYTDRPEFYFNKELRVLGATVWNSGNDGSTSGLDADLLDGQHGSYYAQQSSLNSHISDSTIHYTVGSIDHGSIAGLLDDDHTQYYNQVRGDARYLQLGAKAADSDLLDGFDSSYFSPTTHTHSNYLQFSIDGSNHIQLLSSGATNPWIKPISGYGFLPTVAEDATNTRCGLSNWPFREMHGVQVSASSNWAGQTTRGSYLRLDKSIGSLPGFPTDRYPTIKTDHTALFFSAGGRYTGSCVDNSDTDKYMSVRSDNGSYAYLYGERNGFSGLIAKYRTSSGESYFSQNSSGGVIVLDDAAGSQNVTIRSYGDSHFNGGNVGIGTSAPSGKVHIVVPDAANTIPSTPSIVFGSASGDALPAIYITSDRTDYGYLNYCVALGSVTGFSTAGYYYRVATDNPGTVTSGYLMRVDNYTSQRFAIDYNGDVEISGTIQQDSWTTPTLGTGWSGGYRYRKGKDGLVYISGSGTSGSATVAFTLPVGYRPATTKRIACVDYTGTPSMLLATINTSGAVEVNSGASRSVSLDNIVFELD